MSEIGKGLGEGMSGPFSYNLGRSKGFEQGCIAILFSGDMKASIERYNEINERKGLNQYGKNYLDGMKNMYEILDLGYEVVNNEED